MDELDALPAQPEVSGTTSPDVLSLEQYAIEGRVALATLNQLLEVNRIERTAQLSRVRWDDLLAITQKARI